MKFLRNRVFIFGWKKIPLSYLIANGFWAAPLQQDLFYATGAGNSKTLRALQFRLRILRSVGQKYNSLLCDIWDDIWRCGPGWKWNHFKDTHFVGSEFILSNMARLAWAPLERGSVCDFIKSCLNSTPPVLFTFLWKRENSENHIKLKLPYIEKIFPLHKGNLRIVNRFRGHDLLVQIRWEARFYDWFGGK